MERDHDSSIIAWFRQRFGKPRHLPVSYNRHKHRSSSSSSMCAACSSSISHTHVDSMNMSLTAVHTVSLPHSACSSSSQSHPSLSSSWTSPPALGAPFRWTFKYDVCVCHCNENISQALALVSYLESPSRGLRCYLQPRDCPVGSAVSTELCEAVRDSHCWLLLISPDFLLDNWCKYQMHQAICEGPMSQRIIPALLDISVSQIPHELRFFCAVDLTRDPEAGYARVYRTVLQNLKDRAAESNWRSGGRVEVDSTAHH